MAAAIELHHDDNGIVWPMSIAPFQATLLSLGTSPELRGAADALANALAAEGIEVLYDDRDERAGVKLKDADLMGIPIRIALGEKAFAQGKAEWKLRGSKEVELVPLDKVARKTAEA